MSHHALADQIALVTGATSGIGRGIALAMAKAGAVVAVNHLHDPDAAGDVIASITEAGGQAFPVAADVSRENEVEAMLASVIEEAGRLDILVNNAGIQKDAAFHEMSLSDWQAVLDVNLTGQFLCARAAVRYFLQHGRPARDARAVGKIIFISSVHDVIPWVGRANYAASKGGTDMLMKSLAHEVAAKKIRVNAIAPGAIKTAINEDAWDSEEARAKLLELIPYGRIGETDDIAGAAVWLASDAADYITGTTLYVDGGMTLYPGFKDNG